MATGSTIWGGVILGSSQAITRSTRARRDRPPTARTLFAMADIFATQGKDLQCEFVLRRCVGEYPKFVPAYNSFAELMMRQGRVSEAMVVLSQALEIRPADPVLLNNWGMCLLIRREYEESLQSFTQAAGLRPENKKYRANMATALGLLGRHEESLALLQQVLPDEQARHNAEVLQKVNAQSPAPADTPS
jgi:Flp pilus assembly protein TadD